MIKKFIKYYKNLKNDKIIHQMNGMIFIEAADINFQLNNTITKQVKNYCEEQGYKIDKIIFLTCFDADIKENFENIKMDTIHKFYIVEKDNKYIAYVLINCDIKYAQ